MAIYGTINFGGGLIVKLFRRTHTHSLTVVIIIIIIIITVVLLSESGFQGLF